MSMISSINLSFHFTLIIPMIINVVWAFVLFNYLPSKPVEIFEPVQHYNQEEIDEERKRALSKEITPPKNVRDRGIPIIPLLPPVVNEYIGIINILKKAPQILFVSISLGFLKFISYALFFNLPILLAGSYNVTEASIISLFFDVGMMPGGILVGYLSDIIDGRRASVITCSSFLLIPLLSILAMETLSGLSSIFLLFGVGLLLGGGSNILSSAVCVDFSDNEVFLSSKTVLSRITGLINGIASLIAAIGLLLVPTSESIGYKGVWYLLIISTILSIAFLSPIVYNEVLYHEIPLRVKLSRKGGYDAVPSTRATMKIHFTERELI